MSLYIHSAPLPSKAAHAPRKEPGRKLGKSYEHLTLQVEPTSDFTKNTLQTPQSYDKQANDSHFSVSAEEYYSGGDFSVLISGWNVDIEHSGDTSYVRLGRQKNDGLGSILVIEEAALSLNVVTAQSPSIRPVKHITVEG